MGFFEKVKKGYKEKKEKRAELKKIEETIQKANIMLDAMEKERRGED